MKRTVALTTLSAFILALTGLIYTTSCSQSDDLNLIQSIDASSLTTHLPSHVAITTQTYNSARIKFSAKKISKSNSTLNQDAISCDENEFVELNINTAQSPWKRNLKRHYIIRTGNWLRIRILS